MIAFGKQLGEANEALRCGHRSNPEIRLGIVVYWLEVAADGSAEPGCQAFSSQQLTQALACAEERRRLGHPHVCISTELEEHVGRAGVAAVEGGRTPDGETYEWSKAGRAGKPRRR